MTTRGLTLSVSLLFFISSEDGMFIILSCVFFERLKTNRLTAVCRSISNSLIGQSETEKTTQIPEKPLPTIRRFPDHGDVAQQHACPQEMFYVESYVQFVKESLVHPTGNKKKMHAIHFFPVFVEFAEFAGILVQWCSGKWGKF